jgi:hypothetical protein
MSETKEAPISLLSFAERICRGTIPIEGTNTALVH